METEKMKRVESLADAVREAVAGGKVVSYGLAIITDKGRVSVVSNGESVALIGALEVLKHRSLTVVSKRLPENDGPAP